MRRREFITLLGGAAARGRSRRARSRRASRRIGVLWIRRERSGSTACIAAFRQGLAATRLDRGRQRCGSNIAGQRATSIACEDRGELVALQADVILAATTRRRGRYCSETRTIPIVFARVADPVAAASSTSLARPGGNITGFSVLPSLGGKWLELLKEIAPGLARVAVIFNPETVPPVARFFLGVRPKLVRHRSAWN